MGLQTDLIPWEAADVVGLAFTDDDSQAVVATYPTQEDTANRFYVPFDDTDEEGILFGGIMPQGYDLNQDLKLEIEGWMASATSGKIDLQAAVEAITEGDEIFMPSEASFDTTNSADETVPATATWPMTITITLTNKDSVAAGDMIRIRLHRDADDGTNDTATGDFNLNKMRLFQEAS